MIPHDEIPIARWLSSARLLTARGLVIRGVTAAGGLALLALVKPSDLGLMAVVRGAVLTVESGLQLGLSWPLLQQREDPTARDYAEFAGVQLLLLMAILGVVAAWPDASTLFGLLEPGFRPWFLASLAATLTVPLGTGARIRLERRLAYGPLTTIEVSASLLYVAILIAFALAGRFSSGVFVAQIGIVLWVNLMTYAVAPGPFPSLDGRRLLRRLFSSAGYSTAFVVWTARDRATPLVVAAFFGLAGAGVWAFAVRLTEFVQFAYEGFARAAVPAVGRYAGNRHALRRFVAECLAQAAMLSIPTAAVVLVVLPFVAAVWVQWTDAIPLARVYIPLFTVAGIVATALVPVAVARLGWIALVVEHGVPVVVCWGGFYLLYLAGRRDLEVIAAASGLASVAVLPMISGTDVLPRWADVRGALHRPWSSSRMVEVGSVSPERQPQRVFHDQRASR